LSANPRTSIVFNENEVLRGFSMSIVGQSDTIKVWYNDEHALLLGIRKVIVKTASGSTTNDYPVTPQGVNPGSALYPLVGATALSGDQAGTDPMERPFYPALFVTDITLDPSSKAGDWQFGGTALTPHAVFGTWKSGVRMIDKTVSPATMTVLVDADPAQNNWNLGSGDAAPAGLLNQGYGAEVRWNVNELGLIPGHTYRVQFMVHDGDQNKVGGDVGQACTLICVPEPSYSASGGLGGVTVSLSLNGSTVATATSAADGSYTFPNLPAGNYSVSAPAIFAGRNLNTVNPLAVTLAAGENRKSVNFGYLCGGIEGMIYSDLSGNGSYDAGEPGLSGVTITLSGAASATAITGADGRYVFTGLAAGSYSVSCPATAGGKYLSTASLSSVTLGSGQMRTGINFGYASTISISGNVYGDLNCNGILNTSSESGKSGVTIRLYLGSTQVGSSMTTDANGAYCFKNLMPRVYTVKMSVPGGFSQKLAIAGPGGTVVNNTSINVAATNLNLASYAFQNFLVCPAAGFTTYRQNGWGAKPNGNNPATFLAKWFPAMYPSGLAIGGSCTIRLTSQPAVQIYLPDGGGPNCLKKSYVNPTTTESGVFGAQLAALKINVDFSTRGITKPGLANLKVAPNKKLAGYSVSQILTLANSILGGTTSALPKGCSLSDLTSALDNINKNFDSGTSNGGYLVP
jgi:hypothetical protein